MKPLQQAFFEISGKRLGFNLTSFLNDVIMGMLFREMENTTFHGNSLDNGVEYLSKNEMMFRDNVGIIYHQLSSRFGFLNIPEEYIEELVNCIAHGVKEFLYFLEDFSRFDSRPHQYIYQYRIAADSSATFPVFNLELLELNDVEDAYVGLSEGDYFTVY